MHREYPFQWYLTSGTVSWRPSLDALPAPILEPKPGFWERAGHLRAKLMARKQRARLADTLVAQSCLDHDVRLVTRDDDFRQFARLAGLRLAL